MNIKLQIGNVMYMLDPRPDITAYEVVRLLELVLVSVHSYATGELREQFVLEHNLSRHFKEVV